MIDGRGVGGGNRAFPATAGQGQSLISEFSGRPSITGETLSAKRTVPPHVRLSQPTEQPAGFAPGKCLDLGGHSVMGDVEARSANEELGPTGRDRSGIVLRQVRNVTVTNGTVTGFDAGVAIVGGGDNIVRRVTARDNVNYRLITGRDARPTDVDPIDGPFCWFGDGIVTLNSPRNLVEDNLLVGNGPFSGVSLVGNSDDNVVAKNRAYDNDLINVSPNGD